MRRIYKNWRIKGIITYLVEILTTIHFLADVSNEALVMLLFNVNDW